MDWALYAPLVQNAYTLPPVPKVSSRSGSQFTESCHQLHRNPKDFPLRQRAEVCRTPLTLPLQRSPAPSLSPPPPHTSKSSQPENSSKPDAYHSPPSKKSRPPHLSPAHQRTPPSRTSLNLPPRSHRGPGPPPPSPTHQRTPSSRTPFNSQSTVSQPDKSLKTSEKQKKVRQEADARYRLNTERMQPKYS